MQAELTPGTPLRITAPSLSTPAFPGLDALGFEERLQIFKAGLPEDHRPYADKYFLRSRQILEAEGLNPWVRAQVFIRKGPGTVHGMDEALAILDKFSDLRAQGGAVRVLREGSWYGPCETLMLIEAPIQSIVELETIYLGVLTAETTKANDGVPDVDLADVQGRMSRVVRAANGRPVTYFGPRHWRWDRDAALTHAAWLAGATASSSDIGARTFGSHGMGTIPHALENIYAYKFGKARGVVESTLAFDRVIDPAVPRIALVDYNNREIDDSLCVARALNGRLSGVRVDTCGENVAQGGLSAPQDAAGELWRGIQLPSLSSPVSRYWYGRGVSITAVYALKRALIENGFEQVKLFLTSGFGDAEKVKAFTAAEKLLGVRLFDALGVGGVIHPARFATMDIVAVGETPSSLRPLSKVGRPYRPNERLEKIW